MATRKRPSTPARKISDPVASDAPPVAGPLLLTGKQLAATLGVSLRLVEKWSSTGVIPKLTPSPRMSRYQLHKVIAALERYETATLK